MAKKLTVVANGQPFTAYPGDLLLDAALLQAAEGGRDRRDAVAEIGAEPKQHVRHRGSGR